MKRRINTRWLIPALIAAAGLWGTAARAERAPTDFITISNERIEITGSDRLVVSWEFTAETESLRLTREAMEDAIVTVLYEVRLFERDGTPAAVIPAAVIDPRDGDNETTTHETIFFNDEDFFIMRENALMFSMDASDFDIVSAYGTGEVSGRFTKEISGTARIDTPRSFSIRKTVITVTEVFLSLPTDQDQ
ncbi:MAG: hypothetical protein JW885_01160 [Deltaproteobacteria bacterium]|nr:hypothetical protein [Candidatus Zymogenaceae bacterium]